MLGNRGVSPLVATILLITLAIAFGITILAGYLSALAPSGPPPKRVSLSLLYENSPSRLTLRHLSGDVLFSAFLMRMENRLDARTVKGRLENWKAVEVRVNGVRLGKDRVENVVLVQENLSFLTLAPVAVNLGPGDEVRLENWKVPLSPGEVVTVVYLPTEQTLAEMAVV
jgi:hypothetical protein